MHQLSVCLLALALSSASVEAQLGFGPCPDQPVVDSFFTVIYEGKWYEYSKYLSPGQAVTECGKVTYSATAENGLVDVEEEIKTLGATDSRRGQLKRADPAVSEARFTLRWGENQFEGEEGDQTEVNYEVLDTDYTSYAVVYNCQDFILAHIENVIVYTRTREPDQNTMDALYIALGERGINTLLLSKTNQDGCEED